MNYLATCGIIAFLTGIACALFVFFHKPRTSLKIIWSLYGLGISLWGFGIFRLFTTTDAATALFWGRAVNLFAIFIPIFLFHFVLLFTNRLQSKKTELITYYVIIGFYFLAAIIFSPYFVASVSAKGGFRFYPDAGGVYYAFPFMFLYLLIYGLAILHQAYQTASAIRRNQYKYFFLATLAGIGGGCTTFFLVFNIPIFPFGAIMVPLYNLMIAYMIIKHHLMDIRIMIRKSLVYTILISVIMVFYIIAIYLMERVFQHVLGYQSVMGSVAVMVLIAIVFVPLKNFVQAFVDRRFFKASYLQMVEQNDLLRQQVLRTERYKTLASLSRGIITQLRNPLTALVVYSSELPKRINDQEFLTKFSEVFNKELDRVQILVKQLSEFSEPVALDLKTTNMAALLNELLGSLRPQLQARNITLYKYFSENHEIFITIDIQQIRRALQHVLLNSIGSVTGSGQLWVGMEIYEDLLEISIKDTGCGFAQEELVRIFDPFFVAQGDNGHFGLSIAQNIINNHGGKVSVESELGVGTEWIIQLPGLVR